MRNETTRIHFPGSKVHGFTVCGRLVTDPALNSVTLAKVTCPSCRQAMGAK
jgi:hypothetical protein